MRISREHPGRSTSAAARRLVAVVVAIGMLGAACADDDPTESGASTAHGAPRAASDSTPPALARLAAAPSPYARGDDPWEVWTCHVPATVGHPLYADDTWRMDRSAQDLVAVFEDGVTPWFDRLSHGLYRPVFRAGGRVTIATDQDDTDCVAQAIARASAGVAGVLVVADARHREGVSGGWGRPGTCTDPCRASTVDVTGRAVYVGGADFGPAWGARPPLDLVQHELGHALDLPHSGIDGAGDYTSPIDMMSDSTAPRQVRPDRRDAPDTIAANRIALGWLPLSDVVVVPSTGGTVDLTPSTAASGTRMAVVALDDDRLLTLEVLTPDGADDHLPAAGVAVHLIDQSPGACEDAPGGLCSGQYRRQTVISVGAGHPGIPLVEGGGRFDAGLVTVVVGQLGPRGGRVAIEPG